MRNAHVTGICLAAIVAVYVAASLTGISWGLPSKVHDAWLWPGEPWSGAAILERAEATGRIDASTGADVDIDPLAPEAGPVLVNATPARQAEIVRRYRLFSRQPDEMITLMALSGMDPRAGYLDPKLYQYGGLFIYPVGALIAVGGGFGALTVSGDLTYYLDHPEAFGRFFVVARGYAAAWGVLGVLLMYGIGRRLAGRASGLAAALLFATLPIVTCMAHEAKPHLPGAVLMLAAVWFGMRALDRQRTRDWGGLFVCCGAAVGMVLSAAPIVLLIPVVIGLHCRHQRLRVEHEGGCAVRQVDYRALFVRATLGGWLVAGAVYLATNPYVLVNLFTNRAVLASNFGNSLSMYAIDRVLAGAVRVGQLTCLGATVPVVLAGAVAAVLAVRYRREVALPLAVPAVVLLVQFVLLGAGKPDEYGRFGVFTDCALALGAAALMGAAARRSKPAGGALLVLLTVSGVYGSAGYLWSVRADATSRGSRDEAAAFLATLEPGEPIAVITEPAPYACPPTAFADRRIMLYQQGPADTRADRIALWNDALRDAPVDTPRILVAALDDPQVDLATVVDPFWNDTLIFDPRPAWLPAARIAWSNKPVVVLRRTEP